MAEAKNKDMGVSNENGSGHESPIQKSAEKDLENHHLAHHEKVRISDS